MGVDITILVKIFLRTFQSTGISDKCTTMFSRNWYKLFENFGTICFLIYMRIKNLLIKEVSIIVPWDSGLNKFVQEPTPAHSSLWKYVAGSEHWNELKCVAIALILGSGFPCKLFVISVLRSKHNPLDMILSYAWHVSSQSSRGIWVSLSHWGFVTKQRMCWKSSTQIGGEFVCLLSISNARNPSMASMGTFAGLE